MSSSRPIIITRLLLYNYEVTCFIVVVVVVIIIIIISIGLLSLLGYCYNWELAPDL